MNFSGSQGGDARRLGMGLREKCIFLNLILLLWAFLVEVLEFNPVMVGDSPNGLSEHSEVLPLSLGHHSVSLFYLIVFIYLL